MLPIDSINDFLEQYTNAHTVRAYSSILIEFKYAYKIISNEKYFEYHLLHKALNNYFKGLYVEKKAKSSISRSIYVLNRYFEWAIDNEYIDKNPLRSYERIKLTINDFKTAYLPKDFNFQILLERPDHHTFKGNNARFIFFLLIGFGLKRSEILNLKRGDIIEDDSGTYKLIIRARIEHRTRVYCLEPEAVFEINNFLERRKGHSVYDLYDDDYLLQTSPSDKSVAPIDGSTVYRTIARYLVTDDEKKINPSSFRLYKVLTSIYTRKYYELSYVFGMSQKEISKYRVLDAKERLKKESEELIEEIVKARVAEELKKMTG